jgi:hypothetical protein
MGKYLKAFKNLSALNDFYLTKIRELEKDGRICSYADNCTEDEEIQFLQSVTRITHQSISMLYGCLIADHNGNHSTAQNMLDTVIANMRNYIVDAYANAGDYQDQCNEIRKGEYDSNNVEANK